MIEYIFRGTWKNPKTAYSITINTKNKKLTLYKDGMAVKTYTVAVGKPSSPSPKGTFRIVDRAVRPGGPFGARWLGLSAPGGDYGIHGTNNPSSIGKAVSNGCIRMYNKDIIELARTVPIGTKVTII
jgi:lipoprotein-anchoring transpeptidase ErfK/SrfK